jgi:hypothetical protein
MPYPTYGGSPALPAAMSLRYNSHGGWTNVGCTLRIRITRGGLVDLQGGIVGLLGGHGRVPRLNPPLPMSFAELSRSFATLALA